MFSGLTVDFTSGPRAGVADGSYSAMQELCGASVSSRVSGKRGGGPAFTMTAIVAADDNAIVANLSCAGCTAATAVTAELWVHRGKADEPFDQPTCGADNMPRGGAYVLPTSAKEAAGGALVTRASAVDGVNSAVLSPCGPYINDATQNFTLDKATGGVSLLGGKCLVRMGKSTATGAAGDKTTIGVCRGGSRAKDETWTLAKDGQLHSARDGHCLTVVHASGPYLEVVPCAMGSTAWRFQASGGSDPAAGVLVATREARKPKRQRASAAAPKCLTVVEPSWIDDVALAMQAVDASSGEPVPAPLKVVDDTRVRATMQLQPGQTISVVVASLTSFDLHGKAFARDPLRADRLARGGTDPAVESATLALLSSTIARLGPTGDGIVDAHRRLWTQFWNASSIDIAGNAAARPFDGLDGPLAMLEANYYGSQYILQSAGRMIGTGHSGRKYEMLNGVSTLFGPFNTGAQKQGRLEPRGKWCFPSDRRAVGVVASVGGWVGAGDYIGWNGDITLNYNAESPTYGVFSSNHPELALPYFDAIVDALPLAKRRAARTPWGAGQSGLPG